MSEPRRRTKTPLAERFWAKVDQADPDDCWEPSDGPHHPMCPVGKRAA